MVIGIFIPGYHFSDWQLIVEEFYEEGAIKEAFLGGLTVGFPVDHIHLNICPLVFCHDVVRDRRSQGLLADGLPVS
jgi:hypothetical protein